MASPTPQQYVLARFLAEGSMDRYLRLLRAGVHNQVLKTALAVRESFPGECRFSIPEGGIMLWIELPPWANGIRISCTSPYSDRIEKAIGKLGELICAQKT